MSTPRAPACRRGRIALLAAATLLAASACGNGSLQPPLGPPPVNLVPNPSFELAGVRVGLADGLTGWGDAAFARVTSPVAHGGWAQQVTVPPNGTGGMYFQFPVQADTGYAQAAALDVSRLSPGAEVDLIVEWYDDSLALLGYKMLPVQVVGRRYIQAQQFARSPHGAVAARFVVNIAGGGTVTVDAAQFQKGLTVTPFFG